jgi:predicted SprT family Zn-dependent metalloprotease
MLVDGRLPAPVFTLNWMRRKTRGYFNGGKFVKPDGTTADEIAMNSDLFRSRADRETLGTLVHEMVHQWQHHFGKAPRKGYHDKEWAGAMEARGLMPSDTGFPGGKKTGQAVTHYIIDGGPYDKAYASLASSGFKITWASVPRTPKEGKGGKREKYVCPSCSLQMERKFEASIICKPCTIERLRAEGVPEETIDAIIDLMAVMQPAAGKAPVAVASVVIDDAYLQNMTAYAPKVTFVNGGAL